MDSQEQDHAPHSIGELDLDYMNDLPPISADEYPALLASLDLGREDLPMAIEPLPLDDAWTPSAEVDSEWMQMINDQIPDDRDYTDFESWIPQFERPTQPCDYCRSKHLECYKRKGQSDCYACKSLFRECSLASTTMEASNYASDARGTYFDALHTLDEDACIEQGTRATIKFLNSKNSNLNNNAREGPDDAPGSDKRNGIRFPRHAVKILRAWLDTNQNHPYPSGEEKTRLEETTGLKPSQIANWLANARRRKKMLAKTIPKRSLSPSLRCPTPAIDIVGPDSQWDRMNPLERWKNSPPENEPAAIPDIVNAIANSDLPEPGTSTPSSVDTRRRKGSSNGSGFSARRAASTTSAETSRGSSNGSSAAYSKGSSHGSFGSFSSSLGGKKDRRRKKRQVPTRQPSDDKRRIFQCTFCTDTFKAKYDWTRHEKSLHLSLEKWICAPLGPYVIDQASGDKVCVYCDVHNPPEGHEEIHNHSGCEEKGIDSRTFFRKDHLRQHLHLFHHCEKKLPQTMDAWKFTSTNIVSRCGFCAQRFVTWQERVDHLTGHFRSGVRMTDWRGCRGFDPPVAAQVTNAMPPYLIGIEALSPNPFSATNLGSLENCGNQQAQACQTQKAYAEFMAQSPDAGLPAKATCWEILTIRLGLYANEMNSKRIVITDEMLQKQARVVLYGSDDAWNQTAADNPEWLDLFKKAHGLDYIPMLMGGQGEKVPEDLEWYQDLGMRIPFGVKLEQYNKFQRDKRVENGELRPRKQAEVSHHLLHLIKSLSAEGVLHGAQVVCPHRKCGDNLLNVDILDAEEKIQTQQMRWCDDNLSQDTQGKLWKFIQLVHSGVPVAAPKFNSDESAGSDAESRAKARASCLKYLQFNEVECCPFIEQNETLALRREKQNASAGTHHALAALARAEVGLTDGATEMESNLSVYLPRHKLKLPHDRAKQFATITGAWEDSGKMPAAYSTADGSDLPAELQPDVAALMYGENQAFLDPFALDSLPLTTAAMDPFTSNDSYPALTSAELNSISLTTAMDLGIDDISQADIFSMETD